MVVQVTHTNTDSLCVCFCMFLPWVVATTPVNAPHIRSTTTNNSLAPGLMTSLAFLSALYLFFFSHVFIIIRRSRCSVLQASPNLKFSFDSAGKGRENWFDMEILDHVCIHLDETHVARSRGESRRAVYDGLHMGYKNQQRSSSVRNVCVCLVSGSF